MEETPTRVAPGDGVRDRAWLIVLGVGLLFAAFYGVSIASQPPERYLEVLSYVLYQMVPASALLLSLAPVRRARGLERLGWAGLTIMLAAWTAGDLTYTYYNMLVGEEPPFPGLADLFYYVGYVAFLGALGILAFPRQLAKDSRWIIDAAVVLIAGASLSWTFVLQPIVQDAGYSPLPAAVALGYPSFDFALAMVALLGLYASAGQVSRTILILLAAVTLGAADSVYTYLITTVGYDSTAHPTDVAYIVSYVLLAACFVLPPENERAVRARRQTLLGLLAPYAVAAVMVVLATWLAIGDELETVLFAGTLAVVALVMVRQFLTLRENLGLYRILERESAARRSLLDLVVRAQEDERRRLAFDLHDGPVQALSLLTNRIGAARKFAQRSEPERADSILREVEQAISNEVQHLRVRMMDLRPPALEERGLREAIRDLGHNTMREAGLAFEVQGRIAARPSAAVESMLYRVVQEALVNVRKHARATRTTVTLEGTPREIRLSVEDDGVGFEPQDIAELAASGHFGLLSIVERVKMMDGECAWQRREGGGSKLVVRIPQEAPGEWRAAA